MIALLLLLPPATAAQGEGAFLVEGPIFAPEGTHAHLDTPLAFFVGNASRIENFSLHVPSAKVFLYRDTFQRVDPELPSSPLSDVFPVSVETGGKNDSWTLQGVTVRVLDATDADAFFAIYPDRRASVDIVASTEIAPTPQASYAIGNAEAAGSEGPAATGYYLHENRPNVYLKAACRAEYQGLGGIKIRGLTVEIASEENVTTIRTGAFQTSPTEVTVVHLFLAFEEEALLAVDTGGTSLEVAAPAGDFAGDGLLSFRPTGGRLDTREGAYLPDPDAARAHSPATLQGAFQLSLSPLPGGRSARMAVEGDLRPTGFLFQPAPVSPVERAAPWLALALFGAVVAVGGGALLWRRRHAAAGEAPAPLPAPAEGPAPGVDAEEAAPPSLDVDFCVRSIAKWMEVEEWARALSWVRYAQGLAPTSSRLSNEEGFCLAKLGRLPEAEQAFEQAWQRGLDAEDVLGIVGALEEAGAPLERVERWIGRLLSLAPEYVWTVEEDFRETLQGRVSWERLVEDALRRLEDEWDPKDPKR